jgi:hypothetical protein
MADLVFNRAKGRVIEYYNRVKSNDPANSVIIVIPVDATGVADDTINNFDTLADLFANGISERSTGGWNRKTLTDADLVVLPNPDDTANNFTIALPDLTWPAVSAGLVTDLVVAYDSDSTTGTDANIVPLTFHDFPITPDGTDVVANIASGGFFRAS